MRIIPAIDLYDGCAVRLYQGDYNRLRVYGDPIAFAQQFYEQGARSLHLVDLAGAKQGHPVETETVRNIRRTVPDMRIELGGGLRCGSDVEEAFSTGVDEVILGTAALRDPVFLDRMLERFDSRIVVGVDARDGFVALNGWLNTSGADSVAFCGELRDRGVRRIIYTDISKDGAGAGTNMDIYRTLNTIGGLSVTASGGIYSILEIIELRTVGPEGAIIGRALYDGTLSLTEALRAGGETS